MSVNRIQLFSYSRWRDHLNLDHELSHHSLLNPVRQVCAKTIPTELDMENIHLWTGLTGFRPGMVIRYHHGSSQDIQRPYRPVQGTGTTSDATYSR